MYFKPASDGRPQGIYVFPPLPNSQTLSWTRTFICGLSLPSHHLAVEATREQRERPNRTNSSPGISISVGIGIWRAASHAFFGMEPQSMKQRESRRGFSMLDKRFLLLGVFLAVIAILDVVHASPSLVAQTALDGQSFPSHNLPVLPPGSGPNKGKHGQSRTKKRKLHGRFLHITGELQN